MSLSDTALVTLVEAKNFLRLDAATSLTVSAEYIGAGDGETTEFTLDHTPQSGSLQLYVNNVLQVEDTDFSISGATVTFEAAPTLNYPITASYTYVADDNTFESYDDDLIDKLINAATQKAEDYTGRAFIEREITENRRGDGGTHLFLNKRPVSEIESVTLDGTELTVDSDYEEWLEEGYLTRPVPIPTTHPYMTSSGWTEGKAIVIVYTAGYADTRAATQALVPDAVTAVLIAVANWYENRLGLSSESVTGVGTVNYGGGSAGRQDVSGGAVGGLPPTSKRLLDSYRVMQGIF
jgi:uncharacterized phiE125 gp8 family phage protein